MTDQPALALVTTEFEVGRRAARAHPVLRPRPANVRIELPAAESGDGTDVAEAAHGRP